MINSSPVSRGRRAVLTSVLLSLILLATVWKTLSAQEVQPLPPDLSSSAKSVDSDRATPGEDLQYSILINNDGTEPANSVVMTDTLPLGVALITDSVSIEGGGIYTVANNAITWTGAVNNQAAIEITFNAHLTDTLQAGDWITNTAYISGTGSLITRSVGTEIYTDTSSIIHMPLFSYPSPPPPEPAFGATPRPNADNEWTLSWSVSDATYIDNYTVQEAQSEDFQDVNEIVTTETSQQFSHTASVDNTYYYRVRANGPGGTSDWSDVISVIGNYRDSFNDSSSGWRIARQDTDDVENYSYYDNGHFVLEIDGRWDYGIGSSLAFAPEGPYAIETRVRLGSPDNLHSYGLIFGGDWNGEECNGEEANLDNCFTHYYRLNIIWNGHPSQMVYALSRIERHDPGGNEGRGPTIIPYSTVNVNSPSGGYQTWRVEVYPNGDIELFVNGDKFDEVNDDNFVHEKHFGVFASTDEYLGSEPHFDYYAVTAIED